MPVIKEYEKMGLVAKINGNNSEEQVFEEVKTALGNHLPKQKKKCSLKH